MTKCFEFRYEKNATFINNNNEQVNVEEYIQSIKGSGPIVEGPRKIRGHRVIKVRCNTSEALMMFDLKFLGILNCYQQIDCNSGEVVIDDLDV